MNAIQVRDIEIARMISVLEVELSVLKNLKAKNKTTGLKAYDLHVQAVHSYENIKPVFQKASKVSV